MKDNNMYKNYELILNGDIESYSNLFENIKYVRVSYDDTREKYIELISKMRDCQIFEEYTSIFETLNKIRNYVETMKEYAGIMHSINTEDPFYLDENNYWDEYLPMYQKLDNSLYSELLNSKFEKELVDKYGKQFFNIISCKHKSYSEDIIDLLQKENYLMSEYTRLLASAKIEFDGKVNNLSDMSIYTSSTNEETRNKAIKLHTKFFEDNEERFDEIFDELVDLRNEMALRLGYPSFIELGYDRMLRTDYNPEMVEILRKNIIGKYVPFANKLYDEQAKRISVEKLDYYSEKLEFLDGNAKLIGDADYIISTGKKMYTELSSETEEFIEFLISNKLFDVQARSGKAMGGYCTVLSYYKAPFIFGNFNGTVDDVDVLTHEMGHAFQMYMSRDIEIPEIIFPTLDTCEIHSMSMEFFTYPWMGLFFGDDADKYKNYHYDSTIKFLPYGTLVDHFQHEIYSNPKLSKFERKTLWRSLEKIYLPHRDYKDLGILERGGFWYRQGHIFKDPFYYIDYVLAQLCALQFYEKSKEDYDKAWSSYLEICKIGGVYSFIDTVKIAGLKNPFELL